MTTNNELLTLADIRKLAIHVRYQTAHHKPAAVTYRKLLNQMLSRFPVIKHW